MYKCNYCNKEFQSQRSLSAHKGSVHKVELSKENVRITSRSSNDVIDITYEELRKLKESHTNICDVCGKIETANTRPDTKQTPNSLCIDHDHNTNEFRGFLCVQCNRNFGWYDKYKKNIENHANFNNRKISKKIIKF